MEVTLYLKEEHQRKAVEIIVTEVHFMEVCADSARVKLLDGTTMRFAIDLSVQEM